MKKTDDPIVTFRCCRLLLRPVLIVAVLSSFLAAGCATMDGVSGSAGVKGAENTQDTGLKADKQISQLQSREKELEQQVEDLNAELQAEKTMREYLERRLALAQEAREEAIREVVRIRDRIQGMASNAEATAMFAEARVIMDRMEAEAFSGEALEQLELARSYMKRGKEALDAGSPGGAAYLFDLIPGLYEGMKKTDQRVVRVMVKVAALRESPSSSAPRIENLAEGTSATGLEKNKDWIKVKTASGQTGWLMKSQVR